jgi:hypothetical protein
MEAEVLGEGESMELFGVDFIPPQAATIAANLVAAAVDAGAIGVADDEVLVGDVMEVEADVAVDVELNQLQLEPFVPALVPGLGHGMELWQPLFYDRNDDPSDSGEDWFGEWVYERERSELEFTFRRRYRGDRVVESQITRISAGLCRSGGALSPYAAELWLWRGRRDRHWDRAQMNQDLMVRAS